MTATSINPFFQLGKNGKGNHLEGTSISQPWIEKYRPKSMNDISSQQQVVTVLKKSMESDNLPHLLFYGPPGTGKTSTILALAKELYGPEEYRNHVLELNASDERGIDVIRDKVKSFSKTLVTTSASGPSYKIVILDEADSMTSDAQAALRRVMENFSKITRFCLICNYVTKIIDPLASRCAKFRFVSLEESEMKSRLQMIVKEESISLDNEALDCIIEVSEGDLRKAIMYLQSAARLYGSHQQTIQRQDIYDLAGRIPDSVIHSFLEIWHQSSPPFDHIQALVDQIAAEGYPANQVVSQVTTAIVDDPIFTSIQKSKLMLILGQIDHRLVHGADESLQLTYLLHEGCKVTQSPATSLLLER